MQNERNHSLNVLEGIACFSVVMLHCGFPGVVGKVIYGIARFAVPLFFAISGYFVYSENSDVVCKRLPQKIKHIFLMFLGTEILYFIWHCVQYSMEKSSIEGALEWLASWFSLSNIFNFVFFQKTFIGDVSWFLVAMILCYLTTYIIAKKNIWEKTFIIIPITLFLNVFIGEVMPFMGGQPQWYWCSNFWLLGFPCFAMGYFIKIRQQKLINMFDDKKIIAIIFLSIIVNLAERILTHASQLFISNIPFMFCAFIYCLKYPYKFKKKFIFDFMSNIGEKYSFGIYILHPIVRDIIGLLANKFSFSSSLLYSWTRPIWVILFSIVIYGIWSKTIRVIKGD